MIDWFMFNANLKEFASDGHSFLYCHMIAYSGSVKFFKVGVTCRFIGRLTQFRHSVKGHNGLLIENMIVAPYLNRRNAVEQESIFFDSFRDKRVYLFGSSEWVRLGWGESINHDFCPQFDYSCLHPSLVNFFGKVTNE